MQASSAPMEEKKATPAGVKRVKKGSKLAEVRKVKKQPMLAAYHGDNDKGEEGATADYVDPTRPFEDQNLGLAWYPQWCRMRSALIAKSMPNDIIFPDPTPKRVRDAFSKIASCLDAILVKDSVPCFLRLFIERGEGMHWNFNITSQTLTYMVMNNAMGCAKAALEGKKSELYGMHANPNCMNSYGYFPLHEAAEAFSVDMIKLLFRHGASANVRTVGNRVIEGLLPLHVAVQNACLHKYLEDNLSSIQDHQDYIYNLIHLLCLPEMKIFLDTIRLLAEKTDNLVDEVWTYIKGKKLVEAAVLLMAAQSQIRGGCSPKSEKGKQNGFDVIMCRMMEDLENAQLQLDEKTTLKYASLLVRIIVQAGEALDGYIQHHSKVPHTEVIEHVSSILKDFGYYSTGKGIDVGNLRPYDCKMSDRESHDIGHIDATEACKVTASAAGEKVAMGKRSSGWDPDYSRRMFFPYWRSVLLHRCLVRVYPAYARAPVMSEFDPKVLLNSRRDSMDNVSSTNLNHNLIMSGRTQQPANNYQPRSLFTTAAFTGYGCSRNPNHNLGLLERIRQPTNRHQTRLFSSAAFLLKLLKNA